MKILIVSAGTKNIEYQYSVTNQNKALYCKKHGYSFAFVDLEENRLGSHFKRQEIILKCIDEYDYDYIVWMDCDAWFHNFDMKLEDIIEKYKDYSLIVAREDECYSSLKRYHDAFINSGVLIFKNNDVSKEIINKWKNPSTYGKVWMRQFTNLNDQPFLSIRLLFDDFTIKNSKVVMPQELNKFVFMGYDDDTFILHYPGTTEREDKGVERWNMNGLPVIKYKAEHIGND